MFYEAKMGQNSPEDALDKLNIRELIEFERYCRDYQHWEELRRCYHDDATIVVSWMSGTPDEFVAGSRRMNASKAPAKHKIFDVLIWKNGDRAIAECISAIQIRCPLEGDIVDMSTHTRLHYRVEKRNGVWKIFSMAPIYEKDTLRSMYTDGTLHVAAEELARYRPSYANMMLRQVRYGLHTGRGGRGRLSCAGAAGTRHRRDGHRHLTAGGQDDARARCEACRAARFLRCAWAV